MLRSLKKRYIDIVTRESFAPTYLGIFLNPFYFIRRGLYKGVHSNKGYLTGRLLDFGCGSKPYKALFDVQEYIGLDIEVSGHSIRREAVDVYYDGMTIPFLDNHFDSIFSSEVFEHLFNLEEILSELHRVLKPGGHMLVTLPFVWDEHETPYDFARYTSFGIAHLLKKSGFEIIVMEKSTNYVETIFQMWNTYAIQHLLPKHRYLAPLMTPLCVAPVTIVGILLSKVLPKNKDFFHNNIVVARKPIDGVWQRDYG